MASKPVAVEALIELGLTEYEARCFVALTRLSQGTAKDISQIAEVPQSRVYDITEELHQKGLIDIQESDPKRYFALPVDRALERLAVEFDEHLETASEQLQSLDGQETNQEGVWEIAHREDVKTRVEMHVEHADDEVYLLVTDTVLLEDEPLDALQGAHERGVTVFLEVPDEASREKIHELVPGSRVAVSEFSTASLSATDSRPGRLLMVDEETVLLSELQEGLVPDDIEETGVWGTAVGHGLVAWVRELLITRRERLEFETSG